MLPSNSYQKEKKRKKKRKKLAVRVVSLVRSSYNFFLHSEGTDAALVQRQMTYHHILSYH